MIRETLLPYGRQFIDEDDISAVVDVLRSPLITTGPKCREFEEAIAKYTGVEYAVAVSNGTAALHAACYAAGIGEGDEVITTAITFAASANAVLYCGGTPVFADIDAKTYNIDPEDIRRKITDKTKAIIPVHFTGQPCEMDEIMKIAEEFNLVVIEDGAHVLGSEYKGEKIGCRGDMQTVSFHPVKHITTGEGGVILTNNKDFYDKMMLFRTHGITRDEKLLNRNEGRWYYEQLDLGYNFRITDIQCALGISQLKKLDGFLEKRRALVGYYNELLKDVDGIITPYQSEDANSSWHLYIIKLDSQLVGNCRKEVFDELWKRNIGANVHYIPVYYHPYYQGLGYEKGLCPIAEELYDNMITLPLFTQMTEADVEYVVKNLKEIVGKYK